MPDFTLNTFHKLLVTLKDQQYTFQTFAGFLKEPAKRAIILRHDVDARKMNSLQTARMEEDLGISGTYYFRMVPGSYDEEVIKQISYLGHEIGYHYEELSRSGVRGPGYEEELQLKTQNQLIKRLQDRKTARPQDKVLPEKELADLAIVSFRENLAKLRRVVPVETICMHGSPLSKYDNRMLWEKYDYRDYGIIGEPYFDINFDEVLYLTDTGRRWDGDSVSIRDKAQGTGLSVQGKKERYEVRGMRYEENYALEKKLPTPRTPDPAPIIRFHSTFDIINAAKENKLPDKIMLTIHPQRWDNRPLPWIRELVWQNFKNIGKRLITRSMHNSA